MKYGYRDRLSEQQHDMIIRLRKLGHRVYRDRSGWTLFDGQRQRTIEFSSSLVIAAVTIKEAQAR